MVIRPLRPEDDRTDFSCGDPDFDSFFKKYAGQNHFKHYVGHTAVAESDEKIVGYVTYAVGSLEFDEIPETMRNRLTCVPKYPLPILRLARIAVDERFKHQRIGSQLVRYTLAAALTLRDDYGCVGVVVDSLPERVTFYEELGFSPLEVVEGESSMRPEPVAMFLPVRDIEAVSDG